VYPGSTILNHATRPSSATASYALAAAFVVVALGTSVLLGRILPFTFFLAP
jgi:hypothetical protein